MKAVLLFLLYFCWMCCPVLAQFQDDFSDGEYTTQPGWQGDASKFEIDLNGKLHLNDLAKSGLAYLSTPSQAMVDAVWNFYVEITENPSSTNYARVYLTSDQQNLGGSLQGYFVKIGNTTDEVSLYRQDGLSETKIIDGLDGRVNTQPVRIQVKVTRDSQGQWVLYAQSEGAANFIEEGRTQDSTYPTSQFFGVLCKYTATRFQSFFFDDFVVTGQAGVIEPPPAYRDVLINEIFPDPNPQVDSLPSDSNAEFVELYNRSTRSFNLQGWTLNGKLLPAFMLPPDAYVILCRPEYLNSYQAYGNAIALSSWPSLSNSGGSLTLKDSKNNLADSTAYQGSWVKEGYSLEQINPKQPCDSRINFVPSVHPNGGTPGARNAVFDDTPDTKPPVLLRVAAPRPDSLLLYFDEDVQLTIADLTLNNGVQIQTAQAAATDFKTIILRLSTGLVSGTTYQLTVTQAADCSGNMSGLQSKTFYADYEPPGVLRIDWLDTASVRLVFNEKLKAVAATTLTNYTLLPGGVAPKKVRLAPDSTSVQLEFATAFAMNTLYQVEVKGIEDVSGNIMSALGVDFRTESAIDTVVVVSKNQVDVYFKKFVDVFSAENTANYWLDNDTNRPQAAVVHTGNARLVHLLFSTPLAENKLHTLATSNLADEEYNRLATPAYRFLYDTKPPAIAAIQALDNRQLLITFDEAILHQPERWQISINQEIGTPVRMELQPDRRSVQLTLSKALQPLVKYTVSVTGVTDRAGNTILSAKEKSFVYDRQPPALLSWQWMSPSRLRLVFDEPLELLPAQDRQNYYVSPAGNPDSVWVSGIHPGTVYLQFSESLPEDTSSLVIQNLSDRQGNVFTQPLTVPIHHRDVTLAAVDALSPTAVQLTFSKPINFSGMRKEHFSAGDLMIETITSQDATQVVLYLETPLPPLRAYPFLITAVQDSKGNVSENLRGILQYDPLVASAAISGASALTIRFKVPLSKTAAEVKENFEVSVLGYPAAVVMADAYTVRLIFGQDFQPQQVYSLQIQSFLHPEGIIPASTHSVGMGTAPSYQELLMTEIMADPSPPVDLPEAEYIELLNPTEKIIDLSRLKLSDGSSTAVFPAAILMPGERLLLCATGDDQDLSLLHRTLSLPNFPSLNATGDYLRLTTEQGTEIFSVAYSDAWYNDAQKKQGGWSLEMVDITRPCGEQDNWTASVDPAGGTPGAVNSVSQPNPDRQGPQLLRALVVGDSVVQVAFNEKLDGSSVRPERFALSAGLLVKQAVLSENKKVVSLTLDAPVPAGERLTVTAQYITDCAGNIIAEGYRLATFGRPEKAVKGDILLSEILFAPRPGGVDFVELYNASAKFIDLKGWKFVRIKEDTANETIVLPETLIIAPQQYLAFTADEKILQADYPATRMENTIVNRLPALPATEGTLALLDPDDTVMQRLHYEEAYHHRLLKTKSGVSLERISWQEPADDATLWHSAASLAGFATPGYRNSQWMDAPESQASISVDPKVFAPDQTGIAGYTRIFYRFAEPGNLTTIRIFNANGQKVKDLVQNQTLAQEGFVVWDGTDQQQKTVPMGYYLIMMQVYNPNGRTNVLREKVVVGTRF